MSRTNVLSKYSKDVLLNIPGIKWVSQAGLLFWDKLTGRIRNRLVQKVHVASTEKEKYPVTIATEITKKINWLVIRFPITNESEDEITVTGIDLRFGINRGGAEIGHVLWDSETGAKDPEYVICHDIDRHEEETLTVKLSPPQYVYRAEDSFAVHISGTVEFDTSFGKIQVPVSTSGLVDDETVNHSFASVLEEFERDWNREINS